jgi:hypothetical protein
VVIADAQQHREQYEADDQGVEEDGECQDDMRPEAYRQRPYVD